MTPEQSGSALGMLIIVCIPLYFAYQKSKKPKAPPIINDDAPYETVKEAIDANIEEERRYHPL